MYVLSEAKRKISAVLKAEPTTTTKKKIAKLNFSNFFPCLYNVKVAEAKRNEINVGFFKVFFATDSMHHILYIHLHQMDVAGSLTSTEK